MPGEKREVLHTHPRMIGISAIVRGTGQFGGFF